MENIVFLFYIKYTIIKLDDYMKKILLSLCIFLFPLNVLAYSKKVILGGNTLGIEVKTEGVMVIGFYKVKGKYNTGSLKEGDYILKVNDKNVNSISDLTTLIEDNIDQNNVEITYKRNQKEYKTTLKLVLEDNTFKTGLYVKDGITGIGTLTYVDPNSKVYGALGHEIIESSSNSLVEVKTGKIFKNSITSIDKSITGTPGSKNAKFYKETEYGTIEKNTIYGIYGKYTKFIDNKLIDVADKSEITTGKAKIYTVLSGQDIEEFEIDIKSINETNKIKNISFEINDSKLLEKTGGVVQGMSGSPIVQNDKIIGAVTHVIVDNPTTGYGIFIQTMLEEGDKD